MARCWLTKRSSTAIRIAGAATIRPSSAPPNSGSSAWSGTISAQRTLEAIKDVKWMPAWGEERISNMIATRPDWCISRQRVWGVPIIVFYCDKCQEPMTDRKILDSVVELFREHTADVWYRALGRGVDRPGHRLARAAADANSARKTTFWMSGSIPARATLPCSRRKRPALAVQYVSRRRRSVPRLVP